MHKGHNEMLPDVDMGGEQPVKLTPEGPEQELLSAHVEGYKPAQSLNELETQVFMAKECGANSIEADEKVVRYFTRGSFKEVDKVGYFMYKDIRVFIPGRFAGHRRSDTENIYAKMLSDSRK